MTTTEPRILKVHKSQFWTPVDYYPHPGQELIHNDETRHRVASCGRRFGKSRLGGMELIPQAFAATIERQRLADTGEQRYFWIVGPNYDDGEREWRVFYDACKRLEFPFDKPGTYNDSVGGNMRMSLWEGKFIVEVRSADHPESLDGEGLAGVLLVEAAKLKPSIWHKFIRPALADKRGWSLLTSTPEGKNWFYELWQRGQNPDDSEWKSWRMPSWKNTVVFPGGRNDPEILELQKDMSSERFGQEIGADFTDFVGRVFKDFDEEVHVKNLKYDPRWPVYACCDYGWTNPFVWIILQIDVFDNVYVLGEYRVNRRDTNDIAKDLLSWKGGISSAALKFYPDPASPGDTEILEKALRVRADSNTGGELKYRLEMIRQHLKLSPEHVAWELRQPRLFIDRSCVAGIYEMNEYRFPDVKMDSTRSEPENPMDKDNHFPEALGRFFKGYFGITTDEKMGVTVSRGNMARGRSVHK